jgi:hypothetical protein
MKPNFLDRALETIQSNRLDKPARIVLIGIGIEILAQLIRCYLLFY